MNQASTRTYDEFILRRLNEPFPLIGGYLDPRGNTIMWLAVLIAILLVGVIYVGIMYMRDSRGVGIVWAGLLGLLRLGVYGTIAFIFLLPSRQTYEETSASSRVVVLFDVSESMGTRDDIPKPGERYDKLLTRTQKVQNFLEDTRTDFFPRLNKTNPVSVYRFSTGIDTSPLYLDMDGRAYTKEEYAELEEKRKLPNYQPDPEKHPLTNLYAQHFVNPLTDPNAKEVELPADLSAFDKERTQKLLERNRRLATNKFFSGTNLGDATLNTLTREVNNMVQGIVIFTDGRSTEGSDAAFEQIARLAKSANVPIFVVGIGAVRPQVRIDIEDFRAPTVVQPEDKFRVAATYIGEGLADKEIAPELHITYTEKLEDGKVKRLKLFVAEQDEHIKGKEPKPQKERTQVELNEEIVLKPENPVKFDSSSPPRAEVEFVIDAAALAKANNPSIDLANDPDKRGKKWELGETGNGEMHFQLFVPKDNLELFADTHHKSDVLDLRVNKKPLNILLFASAATHDFQFLNNMLQRSEVVQKRAELSVYVQPPPGKQPEEWFKSVVLGVDPKHLLLHFPNRYDTDDPGDPTGIYDLKNYDAIVAFDPDWSKLDDDQIKKVNTWCGNGGGLVMVGGPINTLQLARPGEHHEKLKPLLDIMPVVLADARLGALARTTEKPWPLVWSEAANNELEFLKLTEDGDTEHTEFKEGWNEFFYGNKKGEGPIKRGFYNLYPTELVKSGSLVIARFGDKDAIPKNQTELQPWIVLNAAGSKERVVWIAWGETRRLRQYSEAFYERFWIKLLRYAGARNQTNLVRRIRLDMSRVYTAGRFVQIEAKIDDRGGQPLDPKPDRMPEIKLKMPAGVDPPEMKITMDRKKGRDASDKGKFTARFQVKAPGDYQLELSVKDTGDSIIQKFNVKESNPELDDTRPDFAQMYHLASDAEQVLARIPNDADRQEVKKALLPPKLDAKAAKDEVLKEGKPRLYFTLDNARLIPGCMVTKTDTKQIRGKYQDMWDFGLRKEDHSNPVFWFFNMLALIVGLLSVEWLIRKLLRLA